VRDVAHLEPQVRKPEPATRDRDHGRIDIHADDIEIGVEGGERMTSSA
jgi:hypothetical protein